MNLSVEDIGDVLTHVFATSLVTVRGDAKIDLNALVRFSDGRFR